MDLEGLAFWRFGVLELSKSAFGCCKFFFVCCFFLNVCLMQRVLTCKP